MFRGIFVLVLLLLSAQSAQAAQFVLSGTASGVWYAEGEPGICGEPRCQATIPIDVPFSFVTSPKSGAFGFEEVSPGHFSFVEYGGVPLIGEVHGTFEKAAGGYIGTGLSGGAWDRYCPPTIMCGVFLSANSFDVRELTASGSAVPEPATWVFLIAGLTTVGGALRLRRKRAILALA